MSSNKITSKASKSEQKKVVKEAEVIQKKAPQNKEENVQSSDNPSTTVSSSEQTGKKPHRDRDITGGLFFIFIGIVLLLNSSGVIPWEIWGEFLRFWPVFLILIGLRIILGGSMIAQAILFILSLAVFTFVGLVGWMRRDNQFRDAVYNRLNGSPAIVTILNKFVSTSSEQMDTELKVEFANGDTESRKMNFVFGSGENTINDSEITESVTLKAKYFEGRGDPLLNSEYTDNTRQVINFSTRTENVNIFDFNFWDVTKYDFMLGGKDIPTDINIDMGSGSTYINLEDQKTDNMYYKIGSGKFDLKLSEKSLPRKVEIDLGSGSCTVEIPKNSAVILKYAIGSGSLTYDSKPFFGIGEFREELSMNAGETVPVFELILKMGSGQTTIVKK